MATEISVMYGSEKVEGKWPLYIFSPFGVEIDIKNENLTYIDVKI